MPYLKPTVFTFLVFASVAFGAVDQELVDRIQERFGTEADQVTRLDKEARKILDIKALEKEVGDLLKQRSFTDQFEFEENFQAVEKMKRRINDLQWRLIEMYERREPVLIVKGNVGRTDVMESIAAKYATSNPWEAFNLEPLDNGSVRIRLRVEGHIYPLLPEENVIEYAFRSQAGLPRRMEALKNDVGEYLASSWKSRAMDVFVSSLPSKLEVKEIFFDSVMDQIMQTYSIDLNSELALQIGGLKKSESLTDIRKGLEQIHTRLEELELQLNFPTVTVRIPEKAALIGLVSEFEDGTTGSKKLKEVEVRGFYWNQIGIENKGLSFNFKRRKFSPPAREFTYQLTYTRLVRAKNAVAREIASLPAAGTEKASFYPNHSRDF